MIESQSLQYRYAQGNALAFPDIQVPQGAVLLVQGPSGCGKSTWLSLVAGLIPPAAGNLTVAGQAMQALSQAGTDAWRARTIGFLPQKLHLSNALSVSHNLALAYWAAGLPDNAAHIQNTLAALGIADLAARKRAEYLGVPAELIPDSRIIEKKRQMREQKRQQQQQQAILQQGAMAAAQSGGEAMGAQLAGAN
jgi:putative ABC transport system ATP-binding protein